ncbi:MAG: ketopantoate reductase family protein, partial [Christensenellales bacterium]
TLEALKRGVKTETEFYNGYIVKLAASKNIETPVNRAVCDMIADIEKDLSKISPDNLKKAVCSVKTSEAQKKNQ